MSLIIERINNGGGSGGATAFLGLTDTPISYAGQAYKALIINSTETGITYGNVAIINDAVINTSMTWSSTKIYNELSSKADINHNHTKDDITDFNESDYVHTFGNECISGNKTFEDDVIIHNTLFVSGTLTYNHMTNNYITNNFFELNSGEVGSGVTAGSAGIIVDRGALPDAILEWKECDEAWAIGISGNTSTIINYNIMSGYVDNELDDFVPEWINENLYITSGDLIIISGNIGSPDTPVENIYTNQLIVLEDAYIHDDLTVEGDVYISGSLGGPGDYIPSAYFDKIYCNDVDPKYVTIDPSAIGDVPRNNTIFNDNSDNRLKYKDTSAINQTIAFLSDMLSEAYSSFSNNIIINGGCQVAQRKNSNLNYYVVNDTVVKGEVDQFGIIGYEQPASTVQIRQADGDANHSSTNCAIKLIDMKLSFTVRGASLVYRIESKDAEKILNKPISLNFRTYRTLPDSYFTDNTGTLQIYAANAKDNWSAKTDLGSNTITRTQDNDYKYTHIIENITLTNALVKNGLEFIINPGTYHGDPTSDEDFDLEISDIQLNLGPTASNFRPETYDETLKKCQRYLYRINKSGTNRASYGAGFAYESHVALISVFFPVIMRERPILNYNNRPYIYGSNYDAEDNANARVNLSLGTGVANRTHKNHALIYTSYYQASLVSNLTKGEGVYLYESDLADSYLEFSAELL